MRSKSFCSPRRQRQASKTGQRCAWAAVLLGLGAVGVPRAARAGEAPQWMRALVNVPLPAHDDKTDAVLLYSEDILSVQGNGKIKRTERRVYKVLRPDGRKYGKVFADFDSETKISSIHGWCIPAQGKDYEVKDKDALETALFGVEDGELMTDLKTRVLTIPAADPGNLMGMRSNNRCGRTSCKMSGHFREKARRFAKRTTRCSFRRAGSTRRCG